MRDKPEGALSVSRRSGSGASIGDAIAAFAVKYPKIQIRFEVGGWSIVRTSFSIAATTLPLIPASARLRAAHQKGSRTLSSWFVQRRHIFGRGIASTPSG